MPDDAAPAPPPAPAPGSAPADPPRPDALDERTVPLADLEPPSGSGPALPPFEPPPRFESASFESYRPAHPSQEAARDRTRAFVEAAGAVGAEGSGRRWTRWLRGARDAAPRGRGLYLDGGFGVGKTHLLAAAYHASGLPADAKRYLSFSELVSAIGALGRERAQRETAGTRLWCIDEFELDDPGNTLIVKTFLAGAFEGGASVITTSNTPPEAQGRGRFNADDFAREIQSIAARFEMVEVEGPDFRRRDRVAAPNGPAELERAARIGPAPVARAGWDELLELLAGMHPIRYRALATRAGTLLVEGMRTLPDQNAALRFVHFVDKLYDERVRLRATSEVPLLELFHPSYREGAYAKKHHRCLSRLSELLEEPLDPGPER